MLIYSMGASVDGFICDRNGGFAWEPPSDVQFQHSLDEVSSLGAYVLGRRLYETMSVWEAPPLPRNTEAGAAFARAWADLPKLVFSRSPREVQGNARLATGSLKDEIDRVVAGTDKDVSIGGSDLAGQAIRLGLVDEVRILRYPVIVGSGSRHLPAVDRDVNLELVEVQRFGQVTLERYRQA